MCIGPALRLDMITPKLIFFRQAQAGRTESCHNGETRNIFVVWLHGSCDREALQNDIASRTGQNHLQRVQEAAVCNFLSQKALCTTG